MSEILSGKELFAVKTIEVGTEGNEQKVKLEFTFGSLWELEDLMDNDINKVFGIFEGEMKASSVAIALWSCLLTHQEQYEGMDEKEIKKEMKKLITGDNFMSVKLACLEVFGSYWKKVKEAKKIPAEYRAVLDEMEAKQNKKK